MGQRLRVAVVLSMVLSVVVVGSPGGVAAASAGQCTINEVPVSTVLSQGECAGLEALYFDTDGSTWDTRTGWETIETAAPSDPCSNWFGVTCDANGLTSLSLSFNGLSGSIPAEVGLLTNLTDLSLGGNELSGLVPASLTGVPLGSLFLSANGCLTAETATAAFVGGLGESGALNMGCAAVDDSAVVVNPPGSVLIDVIANDGVAESAVTDLSVTVTAGAGDTVIEDGKIRYTSIGSPATDSFTYQLCSGTFCDAAQVTVSIGCTISGVAVPTVLNQGECDGLVALYSSTNGAGWNINTGWDTIGTGGPSDPCSDWHGVICNETSLIVLLLSSNELSGSIPVEVGLLTNLLGLDLSSNELSGSIPGEVGQLVNLLGLDLAGNELSGSIPGEVGQLVNLLGLDLFGNELSGSIPGEVGLLTNLTFLSVSANDLSGLVPASITGLPLNFLFLSANGCLTAETDTATFVEGLGQLSALNMGCDAVDDSAVVERPGSVLIDVVANDGVPRLAVTGLRVTVVAGAGDAVIEDGKIRYTSTDSATSDSFTYQVCSGTFCNTAQVTVASEPVFCDGKTVTIDMNLGASGVGTNGDDVILGTPGADSIDAGAGNDTVCAGGGDDTVVGGDGDDILFGEAGGDLIRGGPDADTISGGAGDDRLLGGTGGDTIDGGSGNDFIGGFGGDDIITGGPGDETIFGGFGKDTIDGGPGADNIRGLIGDDVIHGGDGDDKIFGDRGNDVLSGEGGNDIVEGGNAEDQVNGNDGDDTLSGGKRDDTLNGGPGTDVCIGNAHLIADIAIACETVFGVP